MGVLPRKRANLSEDRLSRDEKMQGPGNIDDAYEYRQFLKLYMRFITLAGEAVEHLKCRHAARGCVIDDSQLGNHRYYGLLIDRWMDYEVHEGIQVLRYDQWNWQWKWIGNEACM